MRCQRNGVTGLHQAERQGNVRLNIAARTDSGDDDFHLFFLSFRR
jgi:hypothetical protein